MFFNWIDKKIKNFRWWHISLIKLSTAAFVLMIAKLWPPLIGYDWSTYLIISVIVAIPVANQIFKK